MNHLTMTAISSVLILLLILLEGRTYPTAHPTPKNNKAPTDRQTIGATCQQVKPRSRTNSPKGHRKAQQSFNTSYTTLVNIPWHSTWTTHKFFSHLIVAFKRWKRPPPPPNNKTPNMSTRQQTVRARLQSEKKTAEAALKLQMERGQLKRAEEKKKRDAERKQEEELRKIAEDEQRKLQAPVTEEVAVVSPPSQMDVDDRADPSINSHLRDMMQGSPEEGAAEDDRDVQRSPAKSKQKKTTFAEATAAKPALKPAIKPQKPSFEAHKHTYPRTIVDASIKLTGSTPVQDFIVHLQELLKNGLMVDKTFAFCPINPNGSDKKIHEISGIATNMTMLGAHFKISSNGRNPFEKQKQWGKAKKDKEEFRDPIIYFALAIATDTDPGDLLSRISHEWQRRGGILLRIKELQSFESDTILAFYNIFTATPKKYILQEFRTILQEAQETAQELDPTEFFWPMADLPNNSTLPALEIRLQNPKLPGQDTSHFSKMSWRVQSNRKAFHLECDRRYAAEIKKLTQMAKENNLVEKMWGKHAHISEVVDKDSTPSEIKRLIKVAQSHASYQCSMILEDIIGITNLDATAGIYDEETGTFLGTLSLRQALLRYLRLSDGHQLIAEVHQSDEVMGPVQAVIPNTPEAERMILMMNKNVPAYIGNVLKDQGMPEPFLMELVKKSCCPTQISDMASCTWDSDSGSLTTQREEAEDKNRAVLETASWFKDAFADLGSATNGKSKKPAPPPESLFNLEEDRSVKTVHHRHEEEQQEATTAGNTPPRKGKNEVVELASSDEDSASSSSLDGPRAADAVGDEDSPTSSAEDDGNAVGAADGG